MRTLGDGSLFLLTPSQGYKSFLHLGILSFSSWWHLLLGGWYLLICCTAIFHSKQFVGTAVNEMDFKIRKKGSKEQMLCSDPLC